MYIIPLSIALAPPCNTPDGILPFGDNCFNLTILFWFSLCVGQNSKHYQITKNEENKENNT